MFVDLNRNTIRDKNKIRAVLDAHMLHPEKQRVPWIVSVCSREHKPGGWIYECAMVRSACVEFNEDGSEKEKTYSFTLDDNLMPPLKLSLIECVQVL